MHTRIYKLEYNNIDGKMIEEAANVLIEGGLVAFPTETVYGIGANALNENATKNIYKAKGRPSDNPLIIHIANSNDVIKYARDISKDAYKLMNKFWPGPLTLIFKKRDIVPDIITGGLDTVAIRVPSNKIAHTLIAKANIPIAAPSANLSGRPSPTRVKHVIQDLNHRVDVIIDGGNAEIGLESTVLDVTADIPIILRPGGITKTMLEEVVKEVQVDRALLEDSNHQIPKAPGMKYKHYAPKGKLIVISGEENQVIEAINQWTKEKEDAGDLVGVISTYENKSKYSCKNVLVIGSKYDPNEIASNLFRVLRKMDDRSIAYIYTQAFFEEGIGIATMNRLMKAAGNKKICL